jgi:hypothetical protein
MPSAYSSTSRINRFHAFDDIWDSQLEAKVLIEDRRIDYNMNGPHSAHGWLTPVGFVEAWLRKQDLTIAYRVAQRSGSGQENQRLKKIVADQALDIDMLKELNRGNF